MRRAVLLSLLAMVSACAEKPHATEPGVPADSSSATTVVTDAEPPAIPDDAAATTEDAGTAKADEPEKPMLSTKSLASFVFDKPSIAAWHVGIIRAGYKVARTAEPLEGPACPGGGKWYGVEPRGYVCEGYEGITLDMDDPAVVAASKYPPRVGEPFPYGYATSWGSPMYARVPTEQQAKAIEGDIEGRIKAREALRAKMSERKRWPETAMPTGEMPDFLKDHALSPNFADMKLAANAVVARNAWPDMRLSLLAAFDVDGRVFYWTSEGFLVPNDRVRPAKLADFHGVDLAPPDAKEGEHLPFVWVNWKPTMIYRLDEHGGLRPTKQMLPVQAHVPIAQEEMFVGQQRYFELLTIPDGIDLEPGQRYFVPNGNATRLDAVTELPEGVTADDDWIDIAIGHQTLVLYHGLVPLFATLVSTGVDGADDPLTTKSTPRGTFRIVSKHITARMAADEKPSAKEGEKGDPRYRIDDVPYVQYFLGSWAIHGAYWHDAFGQPKSHGCVNMSPRDALRLFGWTKPTMPQGWHAVWSQRDGVPPTANGAPPEKGTLVHIRVF